MSKLSLIREDKKPWYHKGLRFECTECGKCCTGAPGYVWVKEEEIQKIAKYLKLSLDAFASKYLRKVGNRWSLKENQKTYDCLFLKGKQCTIYTVRPKQCRSFPWWPSNLRSLEAWEKAAEECEGINDQAPIRSFQEIQQVLENQ